jgi:hypothetical protein
MHNISNSEGFWWWCTARATSMFLDFVHCIMFLKKHNFWKQDQWLRLALSKERNRVDAPHHFTWGWKQIKFLKHCAFRNITQWTKPKHMILYYITAYVPALSIHFLTCRVMLVTAYHNMYPEMLVTTLITLSSRFLSFVWWTCSLSHPTWKCHKSSPVWTVGRLLMNAMSLKPSSWEVIMQPSAKWRLAPSCMKWSVLFYH